MAHIIDLRGMVQPSSVSHLSGGKRSGMPRIVSARIKRSNIAQQIGLGMFEELRRCDEPSIGY